MSYYDILQAIVLETMSDEFCGRRTRVVESVMPKKMPGRALGVPGCGGREVASDSLVKESASSEERLVPLDWP